MAFVVEDGTGLTTANSYLSVSDADDYHTDLGQSDWTGTDAVKESALRKATKYLDSTYVWAGTIKSTTQSLNWPREGVVDSEGRDLDNQVPSKIKDATAELALLSLSGDLVTTTTNSDYVKREKIEGAVEVEYSASAPIGRQYRAVDRILNDIYTDKIGQSSMVKLERC